MADGDYDLWDTLNLQRGASVDEVRVAFRELSRLYHPDKHVLAGEGENAAFVRVHRAYRILSDEALRGFYEKYGLSGVRLAESLSDDDGVDHGEGAISVPDDRLKDLESRVQRLVRKHEELRAQRLLSLNGSFVLSTAATAKPGAPLKRRFRLQYSALSHSVQIHLAERFRLSVGCASHVQSSSGAGAAKLLLAANVTVAPGTNLRASCNVTGSTPDAELSIVRSLSPHCIVRQQLGYSRDGRYLALNVSPWLTRTLRGGLTGTLSSDPSLGFNLVKTSLSCGHSAKMFVDLQPGAGEVGCTFKYKPVKGFSMKVSPTLSRQGAAVQLICTKASADALTKLHWSLQVRAHGLALRLTLCRCGLRFVFPLELWSEASGPVPAAELGLAMLLWAAPPFVLRLLHTSVALISAQFSKAFAAPQKDEPPASSEEDAHKAEAFRQRAFLTGEAARRRKEEEDVNGLVILSAHYGSKAAMQNGLKHGLSEAKGVIDVTNCLMAKVRHSQLQISSAPKSTLLGFGRPEEDGADPVLHISYRFGGADFGRSFGEHDVEEMGEQFRWNPSEDRMGQMLLQAVYMEDQVTLEHLIKQKANLESRDETGATALHIATTRNMASTVSWLLRHRADCFAKDGDGYHALTWACIKGHLQIVKILLEARASIEEAASSSGKTPLSLAAERGHMEVVEELLAKQARLDQTNTDGSTPLHAAAHQCEVEVVARLLSRKSLVNVADNEGWTPLMYAVNSPAAASDSVRPELSERKVHIEGAIGRKSTLELLLLHKADANAQSVDGFSPLIIVCAYDRPHAVKQLLDAKAQVNMATMKGQSAMLMAAVNDLPVVAKALIAGSADVNQANGKGESPLSVSEKNGFREVADLLKSAGALPPKGGKKKGRK
ncbi:unnamed protein product [Symbiodinium sp. CCMP2592]|nr:unnamed protein product [Symbiodinium sp. CCMP2592]